MQWLHTNIIVKKKAFTDFISEISNWFVLFSFIDWKIILNNLILVRDVLGLYWLQAVIVELGICVQTEPVTNIAKFWFFVKNA